MTFADKLRWHREKAGLTRQHVAGKIGVSVATVSAWERGIAEPRYRAFLDLCSLFDVPVAALMGDVPKKKDAA